MIALSECSNYAAITTVGCSPTQPTTSSKMTAAPPDSPTTSPRHHDDPQDHDLVPNCIPIEIISEEEMALLETALASAATVRTSFSSLLSSQLQTNAVANVRSISIVSKKRLSSCSRSDIEDCSGSRAGSKKKNGAWPSLFQKFRGRRGLAVTDITSTEWCEKQMEFVLLRRKRITSEAMKAGSERHEKLEQEVVTRVEVRIKTAEDRWAVRFMNFIVGTNQLLFDGLTRELPVIGIVEGVWMLGVIDEIQMPAEQTDRLAVLVDTKTRKRNTLPAEPQSRNGRLQLMCYKYLWDNSAADNFPFDQFIDFFKLDPHKKLSKEIKESAVSLGLQTETLDEMVKCYRNTCKVLPSAHSQLLLRYEWQKDHSLLGEDKFEYNGDWLKDRVRSCLEFWKGEREANYAPDEERWKCSHCQFASECPATARTTRGDEGSSSSMESNSQAVAKD